MVVSNRVPPPEPVVREGGRADPVGGLVSAIRPVMETEGGLWFGWSGVGTSTKPSATPTVTSSGRMQTATVDLSEDEVGLYYSGFANRTLWPVLHTFPERAVIRRDTYAAYRRINQRFAETLYPMLRSDDLVWVHDFHLFHVGAELRDLGWRGRIGFFLHVPFPSPDVFSILPWARQILDALLQYDLVGFQSRKDLHYAVDTFQSELSAKTRKGEVTHEEVSVAVGSYPIGIDMSPFQANTDGNGPAVAPRGNGGERIILGVDRLDYTKGIPLRLRAFGRLLEHSPALRGNVCFTQISTPSRTRVPEYTREKEQVDQLVGQINGRFSGADWTPIRYLYRSYLAHELTHFYREADVGFVTPLRDGMNLVAKEFVASQSDDPGVLVLSRFAGAAESLRQALIVNPYDVDGTALALDEALRMPLQERRQRWSALMKAVSRETAHTWFASFTRDLAAR